MTGKSSRVDYSLLGSERDQIVRPKVDGVVLEEVQLRVFIARYGRELSQGSKVLLPSASSRVSGSVTLKLKTNGREVSVDGRSCCSQY